MVISPVVVKQRHSWTYPEIEAVRRSFGNRRSINVGIVPTFEERHKCRDENPCLRNKTPPQIKSFVVHQTNKKRANGQSGGN